jgi:putative endonuclease
MARWHVYILKCGDGTLYTGIATDVKRRLAEHRAGTGAKYTRGREPLRLAYTQRLANRSRALKREMEIKQLSRRQKLQIIKGG